MGHAPPPTGAVRVLKNSYEKSGLITRGTTRAEIKLQRLARCDHRREGPDQARNPRRWKNHRSGRQHEIRVVVPSTIQNAKKLALVAVYTKAVYTNKCFGPWSDLPAAKAARGIRTGRPELRAKRMRATKARRARSRSPLRSLQGSLCGAIACGKCNMVRSYGNGSFINNVVNKTIEDGIRVIAALRFSV